MIIRKWCFIVSLLCSLISLFLTVTHHLAEDVVVATQCFAWVCWLYAWLWLWTGLTVKEIGDDN